MRPRRTERSPEVAAAESARAEQRMSFWPTWPEPFGLGLDASPAEPCPYFADRQMSVRGFLCHRVDGAAYQDLLDAGFRRSGSVYYQPTCAGCRDCVPLRVAVERFRPDRSQRRCRARNADLRVVVGAPQPSAEKHALYRRYLAARHDGTQDASPQAFIDFLYAPSTETVELSYRDRDDRLLAVGICDITPVAVSAVYVYFDPADEHRGRGLGTYANLYQIEYTRRGGRNWYYMGYWIEGAPAMCYKRRFRPCEALCTDGVWRPLAL